MNLLTKLRAISSVGLGLALRALANTFQKERQDRRYGVKQAIRGEPIYPGTLLKTNEFSAGARFQFKYTWLEVRFLAADLARLSWEPGSPPHPYALAGQDWSPVEIPIHPAPGGKLLESDALQILIQEDGGLIFSTPEGKILRTELPPVRTDGKEPAWTDSAPLRADEQIYGLGERTGSLNRRGRAYAMWNTEAGGVYGADQDPLYLCLPVYLGLHQEGSYLIFYENPHRAIFDFRTDRATAGFERGMLRYYFIPGPPDRALARYSELTGRAPLPPRWALGYHQSRWGYRTAGDIRAIAAGFRQRGMPLSAIHLDTDYMDGCRVFTINLERFPDLPSLSAELIQENVRLVAIIDPGVKVDPGFPLYQQGVQQDVFCRNPDGKRLTGVVWPGWTAFPDFTDPKVRHWWGEQYPLLMEAGISGFWHDMNEPSSFAAFGEMTFPLSTRHSLEGCGGDHRTGHNLYGLEMNRAGYEGLQRLRPGRRPWIVSRSGWAGQQRYGWNWTGDIDSSWTALRQTIPMVLGISLSGQPYSGPDIGGFSGSPSAELYTRWFQMAAFLPFFRTHSARYTRPREPWSFGEPYSRIIADFLRLRYRLLPYWYTLAWQSSQNGAPLIRPLFWPDGQEPALWDVEDAFLLGNSLLVAPIGEAGAAGREVRLPKGAWFDFWKDDVYEGSQTIAVKTGLQRIPLFVRAGCVLPLESDGRLELHVYAPENPQEYSPAGYLYSDAGDGYGVHRVDTFSIKSEPDRLEVGWISQGEYPFPYPAVSLHFHGFRPRQAWIDGKPLDVREERVEAGVFRSLIASLDSPDS